MTDDNEIIGITAFGGYVPRLRFNPQAVVDANAWFNPGLQSLAKGERAFCNWDEDSLIMAIEAGHNSWDGSHFLTTRYAAERAYQEAGIEKPRDDISMFEVHDFFSITELVNMEDLFLSDDGRAWRDIMDGRYNADGQIPLSDRRRVEMFRPSHRRIRSAHALRNVFTATGSRR